MAFLTKKELIDQYAKNIISDNAVYNPSAFDAYILVEWTDEWVFGYYQYQNNEKEFFKVKLKPLNDNYYFEVKQHYLKLSMFMRLSYGGAR